MADFSAGEGGLFFALSLVGTVSQVEASSGVFAAVVFVAFGWSSVGWEVDGFFCFGVSDVAAVFWFVGVVVVCEVVVAAEGDDGVGVGFAAVFVGFGVVALGVDGEVVAAGVGAEDLVAGDGGEELFAGEAFVFE